MKLKKLLLASKVDEAVSGTGGNGGVLEGLLVDTVVGGTWLYSGMISHDLKFLALFPFSKRVSMGNFPTTLYYYTCNSYLETVKMALGSTAFATIMAHS